MATVLGVDYAWSHPGGKALADAGKKFACRYLSNDGSKNLTHAEADDLAAHGVSSVVVWETTAQRPLSGRAAGIADAERAAVQAAACGMPSGRPVYFAVDFDATARQMPAVMAYLDGAGSVLGAGRVGVYGGIATVRAALDGGHARWAWQTAAWSGGRWDPRAHIRQFASTVAINGVSCDLNTAQTADYGQWMPGRTPTVQEDDMQLTDKVTIPAGPWTKTPVTATVGDLLGYTNLKADAAVVAVRALTAQVAALAATVGKLAQGGGLTAAEITAAAEAGATAALDQLGDALTTHTTED